MSIRRLASLEIKLNCEKHRPFVVWVEIKADETQEQALERFHGAPEAPDWPHVVAFGSGKELNVEEWVAKHRPDNQV